MVFPFLAYLIMAVIFAYILKPVQEKIKTVFGRNLSSLIVIILFLIVLLLPFSVALAFIAEDAAQLIENIEEGELIDLDALEDYIEGLTGEEMDIQETLNEALDQFINIAIGQVSEIIERVTEFLLGIFMLFFVLFYLLRDGEKFYDWVRTNFPLEKDTQDQLSRKLDLMTKSVLKGHVLVAIAEGIIGGIGLAIAGVPNYFFWTFIMVIAAFIPVVGPFLVWGPASIYLIIIGQPIPAIFLALYGTFIIGLADNLLRPYLIDKRADIHPAAILIGVIGGIYLLGAIGIIIGPIIIGFAKTVTETWTLNIKKQDYTLEKDI